MFGMKGEGKRVIIIVVPLAQMLLLVLVITAASDGGVLLTWQALFKYCIIEFLGKS